MTEKNDDRNDAPQRPRQTHGFKQADHSTGQQGDFRVSDKGHDSGNEAAASFRKQLDEHGARTIQLAYSDLLGRAGSLIVPAADYQRLLSGIPLMAETKSDDDGVSVAPDMRTLRFLPLTGSAGTLARLACDLRSSGGEPMVSCPRSCLKRALDTLRRAGLSARAFLDCRLPIDARAGSDLVLSFEKALADLSACRVPGLIIRLAEDADCAIVSLGPLPLLDVVDLMPVVCTVLGHVRPSADFGASPTVCGIGLMLHRGKRNLFSDQPANKDAAAAFLSGTSIHAAGLSALFRPMLSGMAAGPLAGPVTAGTEGERGWWWKRGWAAGLGICHHGSADCISVSGLDGTGSLSLMLAGLIAAGLDGLRNAGGASPSEFAGVPPECPPDPGLALAALIADECLCDAIGLPTVEAYAALLRESWEKRWMTAKH